MSYKSSKTFPAWQSLTGYNKIFLDPFLRLLGEDDNFIVIKSLMGVDDRIHCFEKGISVTVNPQEWDRKSQPILTLGGMSANILEIKTRKGRKTLSYHADREQISDKLKKEIMKEEI